jgi:hypothetical protein
MKPAEEAREREDRLTVPQLARGGGEARLYTPREAVSASGRSSRHQTRSLTGRG